MFSWSSSENIGRDKEASEGAACLRSWWAHFTVHIPKLV